ncbi:Vinorine synthase [Glycine soja]|uniref:Vinorine synthase n=2 Tax=Glycine soja TaxID=3848 RepID=A0A0B2PS26_GLYSO|nr:Vinorine synthase [Glycine soja]
MTRLFITCNDEGALYLEAKLNLNMVEFLTPPKLKFLNKLLPCEPNKMHSYRETLPQVLVQVNIFNCGGRAIGTCSLHTLLQAICRDSREEVAFPDLTFASSYFSPLNDLSLHDHKKMCTTTRFMFGFESINSLRVEAKDGDYDESSKPLTRYEVLAAFIWKHMKPTCKMESNSTRPAVAIHIVDMRRRIGEPFSRYTIGNILWPMMVFCEKVNAETSVGYLVSIAKEKFGNLSSEWFLRVKSDPNILGSTQCMDLTQGIETRSPIPITSWSGLNFRGLDFGFGKPLWVGVTGGDKETLPDEVVIMEIDEAIEAWLTMEMQHIANLERDIEFLILALPNASVSNIWF